jgi:quercetin dioxygenase-like cupin family protein
MKVKRWQKTTVPSEAALQAALQADGYFVYRWTDSPGTTYPPHAHDDDQSHWVLRGAMILTVGSDHYVLRAGDRDWLPAGTVHSARVEGEEPVTYLIGSKRLD